MIAEVVVDITNSELDRIFDYDTGAFCVTAGFRVVVPFGNRQIEGIIVRIKNKSNLDPSKVKPITRIIDSFPVLTDETLALVDYITERYKVTKASALRLFLPSEMRRGKVSEKTVEFIRKNSEIDYNQALSSLRSNAQKQRDALKKVFGCDKVQASALRSEFGNSSIKQLLDKGYLILEQTKLSRVPYSEMPFENKSVVLKPAQIEAINSILATDKPISLLHGVTGSGKTEVYLELIKQAIQSGKTAIMLVPEISLTPQTLRQFRARFSNVCAILHSGLSAGEKYDEWLRLRTGEAKIAIGARSAIFAPLKNIGIIVIDEEHDGSYESESTPRYSTIDIAKFRAEKNECKIVLGSATPSVASYLKAKEGIYNLVKMPERINKKPLPEIIVSDMRQEVRRGNNSFFSASLKDELQKTLSNGNQAIIFLNRRGYSQQIICRECGYVASCKECDVSLNYHSDGNILKCHYCGTNYRMISACPECGSSNISFIGTGTQKIVSELKELFPKASILRMDNDTTSNKEGHFKILNAFAEHKADILVGTQMIAKGHDFPSVTFVGILDADMSLHFSDYRCSERTFQLLTQVAGRCGRADEKGTVVLQTYSPDNPVLKFALNYDYDGFFNRELSIRQATHFPPYSKIIRVLVESQNENDAIQTLKNVFFELKAVYDENKNDFFFFSKMKSPIKRLKNKYRFQVLMRITENNDILRAKIFDASLKYKNPTALITIEENPPSLS